MNKNSYNQLIKEIKDLVTQGININRLAQEKDILYLDENNLVDSAHKVYKKYILWIESIKKCLNKEELVEILDLTKLYLSDSVQRVSSLGINSKEIQATIKNIRAETEKKITWLQNIKFTLSEQPIWRQAKIARKIKSSFIKKITCVKQNYTNNYLIIINNDYQFPLEVDGSKSSWQLLFEVAENKSTFRDPEKKVKNNLYFLNSKKDCKLYSQTGYKPEKILDQKGEIISALIDIGVISEKQYKIRRKNG